MIQLLKVFPVNKIYMMDSNTEIISLESKMLFYFGLCWNPQQVTHAAPDVVNTENSHTGEGDNLTDTCQEHRARYRGWIQQSDIVDFSPINRGAAI